MIKNSLIHKDSIDIIKNIDATSSIWVEHTCMKGVKGIVGCLKLDNVVI